MNYPDNYWWLRLKCPECERDVFECDCECACECECECEGVRKQEGVFSRSSVSRGRGISKGELKRWLECGSTGRTLEEVYNG